MKVVVAKKRGVSIVRPMGRLVLGDGEGTLIHAVTELLEDGERRVVLNLDGLSILDSAGVGEIVRCYKQADDKGAVLKIALASGSLVHHLFQRSGLGHALEVFEDESEAVDSYS